MKKNRISVPKEFLALAGNLYEIYLNRAKEMLYEHIWYKTCPDELKNTISITLERLEVSEKRNFIGIPKGEAIYIIFIASAPNGESHSFYVPV